MILGYVLTHITVALQDDSDPPFAQNPTKEKKGFMITSDALT